RVRAGSGRGKRQALPCLVAFDSSSPFICALFFRIRIIALKSRLAKPVKPLEIGTWLRGLGLGQYEAAFRDNDVDAEVLPQLTAEDLISIGVTSVGHRRKL